MITFSESLLNQSITPVGFGWPIPIENGRFWLTPQYDIVDTGNADYKYRWDRNVSLEVAQVEVPGLTLEPTNILYFFAAAVKPLVNISDADLLDNLGRLPSFINDGDKKAELDPADVFWELKDGGFEFEAGKLLIPGFSGYYVDKVNHTVHHVDTNAEVVVGTNRGRMAVLKDHYGNLVEVDIAHVVLYANGMLEADNLEPRLYFADGDGTNLDPANILTKAPSSTVTTTAIVDESDDFVLQEGDGQTL